MSGKRVTAAETGTKAKKAPKKGSRVLLGVAGVAAAAVVAAAGFCAYANARTGVFPGVSVWGEDLTGLSLAQSEETLAAALTDQLDAHTVTVTADGETLGAFRPSQLGAAVDAVGSAQDAYAVGRESGFVGWLKNGVTMAKGLLGAKTEIEAEVTYDQTALETAVSSLADSFDRSPVDGSYTLSRDGLFAAKGVAGRTLDQQALIQELSTGADTVEATWTATPAQELDVSAMASTLSATASPARYDKETGKVVDGEVGVEIDEAQAEYVLSAAADGETVQLPAQIVYPDMTASEMEAVLFRDLLGTCTTSVGGSSIRKGNVKLAAEFVNGTILNDGDEFNYNQVVGERTTERGFGAAPSYVNGLTVDTVGGGICQVSSTIYRAALLANLNIVERYNHRYYPGYIELGQDATVSWGGPEFRFKNNTGYPVRIDVSYSGGQLTVNIYGTNLEGTYVKMTYETLSTTDYETEYVETDELPYGTQKEQQNGYKGYVVNTYRNVYDKNGNLLSSTFEAKSDYKSRNRIVLVGTAGAPEDTAAEAPAADAGTTTDTSSVTTDDAPPDTAAEPVLPGE